VRWALLVGVILPASSASTERGLSAPIDDCSCDGLDASAVACVLASLRTRHRRAAIRLTYDRPRYERLIETCGRG